MFSYGHNDQPQFKFSCRGDYEIKKFSRDMDPHQKFIILYSYFKCSKTLNKENNFDRNTAFLNEEKHDHALEKFKTPPPTVIEFQLLIEAYLLISIYNLI